MEAVLFDLFGTLVPNWSPSAFERLTRELADCYGVEHARFHAAISSQFPKRVRGEILDGPGQFEPLLEALATKASERQHRHAEACWAAFLDVGLRPKDDAVAVLAAIDSRGLPMALVTDCSSSVPARLDATDLGRFLPVRACSAQLGMTKPDPRVYQHAIDALGVPGPSCLYVGDGNSGELPGAAAFGMTTVWVDNGAAVGLKNDFRPEADHRVTSLRQVLQLL